MKALVAVVAVLSAFVSRAAPAAAEPVTIRISFSQVGTGNRLYAGMQTSAIAHARGFVEDEFKGDPDVRIAWTFFRGAGPATNEAVANGQVDFFSQGDLPSIVGRSVGLQTRLLLSVAARQNRYLAVPAASDLHDIRELRGKKVAQHLGTSISLSIPKILAAYGLGDRDVRFVNLDDAGMLAALIAGDVDAAFGPQKLLDLASRGTVRTVTTTRRSPARRRSSSPRRSSAPIPTSPTGWSRRWSAPPPGRRTKTTGTRCSTPGR